MTGLFSLPHPIFFRTVPPMFSLEGKIAVVTGGGSGIGLAISKTFVQQGATVDILEVDEEAGETAVKEIAETGGTSSSHVCDVTQPDKVKETFDKIINSRGRLDCLINNAGVAHVGNVLNTSEDDFDRVLSVNVKGVYNCLKAGVTHMRVGGGAIVNIASTVSVFFPSRTGNVMRAPSNTSAGERSSPLIWTRETESAMRSMKVWASARALASWTVTNCVHAWLKTEEEEGGEAAAARRQPQDHSSRSRCG